MKRFPQTIVICIAMLCIFLMYGAGNAANRSEKLTETEINYIVEIFRDNDFDREFLERVFTDARLRFIPRVVKCNVINKEHPDNYNRFLEPVAIGMAKIFSKRWRTRLNNASRTSDVDKEIIVAILLVETSLGECLGKDSVMSVFSSIILGNHGKRRKDIEKILAGDPGKEQYLSRLAVKAQWAQKEMRALLRMHKERNIEICELTGSYAGAFGISQFLPSSYLKWGYDADNNNIVDLFYMPDAIASVVNFLKSHGWKKGLYHEENKKVLWCYNNSAVYVETVLRIAQKLQQSAANKLARFPVDS